MENKKTGIYVISGVLGVVILTLLDQWTKKWAVLHLAGQPDIILIKGVFQLHYLENKGAAFGIFQNQRIIFLILTIVYLLAAGWFYLKIPRKKKYLFLHVITVLLTGGAIGNFIDRLLNGYVVDFFYFSLIDFPVFNVADIFVVAAFIGVALSLLVIYKEDDFSFLGRKKQV